MIFAVIAIGLVWVIVMPSIMAADLEKKAEKLRRQLIAEDEQFDSHSSDMAHAEAHLKIIEAQGRLQQQILERQRELSVIDIPHGRIRFTDSRRGIVPPEQVSLPDNFLLGGQHGYNQSAGHSATDFKSCDAGAGSAEAGIFREDAGGVCGDISQ
jgi:hypothetical protein